MQVTGCVHVHLKDGDVSNVFLHLSGLPENGVVHLVPDDILSIEEFVESHPMDKNELSLQPQKIVYNLGDESV